MGWLLLSLCQGAEERGQPHLVEYRAAAYPNRAEPDYYKSAHLVGCFGLNWSRPSGQISAPLVVVVLRFDDERRVVQIEATDQADQLAVKATKSYEIIQIGETVVRRFSIDTILDNEDSPHDSYLTGTRDFSFSAGVLRVNSKIRTRSRTFVVFPTDESTTNWMEFQLLRWPLAPGQSVREGL